MKQVGKIFHLAEDGFVGSMYWGSKYKDCAMIYLPGAKMDEQKTNDCAEYYIDRGYHILVHRIINK